MENIVIRAAAIIVIHSVTTQTHVGNLNIVGCGIGGNPVEPANNIRPTPATAGVEDFDGNQLGFRRHANDSDIIIEGRHGAGDVGAVAIVVVGGFTTDTAD